MIEKPQQSGCCVTRKEKYSSEARTRCKFHESSRRVMIIIIISIIIAVVIIWFCMYVNVCLCTGYLSAIGAVEKIFYFFFSLSIQHVNKH